MPGTASTAAPPAANAPPHLSAPTSQRRFSLGAAAEDARVELELCNTRRNANRRTANTAAQQKKLFHPCPARPAFPQAAPCESENSFNAMRIPSSQRAVLS